MSMRIHRRFVRIGQRHVHLRHAGHGPGLVLLHQSPQNSRMWLDMIARFAHRHTVIAPDTPGFGYSDALDVAEPSIADLATATVAVLDALGIDRFAVFGMHTGGLVAAQIAAAYPERVSALVVDGYAAFTAAESAIYGDRYLPPFVPAWDGLAVGARTPPAAALAGTLGRRPPPAARRPVAAPTPAQVNDNVVELLRLGERCKPMFRAAAAPGLAARLGALDVPLAAGSSASADDYLGRAATSPPVSRRC